MTIYFKSRSTSVYVAFLEASEAFEKSHWTLLRKLIDRKVPTLINLDLVLLISTLINICPMGMFHFKCF